MESGNIQEEENIGYGTIEASNTMENRKTIYITCDEAIEYFG